MDARSTRRRSPETTGRKGIPCLSVDSISLAHLFHETGAKVVGYEDGRDQRPRADADRLRARGGPAVRRGLDQLRQRQLRRRLQLLHAAARSCRAAPELVPQQVRHHRRRQHRLVPQAVLPELPRRRLGDLLGAEPRQPVDPPRPRHAPDPALAVRPGHRGLPGVRRPPARPRRAVHAGRAPAQLRPRLRARSTTRARC